MTTDKNSPGVPVRGEKMQINTDKKIIEKTIIGVITMSLLLSPSALVWCGDYPVGYLGPGHGEYLNNKIQNGYYVEVFTDLEGRQEERVNKRNQIKELVSHSYQANYDSAYGILKANYLISQNAQEINWTIQQNQNRSEENASNLTEFKYIKYSDGKIVNFKEGLPSSIENERVVDEFGNLSIKHTYNMKYNFERLLTCYEADLKDNLGNITHIFCYGITYSPDSVFYGGYDTSANKNETEKYIKEIDSAGNVRLTHWKALSYDGKLLRAFSQEIEDSIYGKTSFIRSNIKYENNNYRRISSYHEEGVGANGLAFETRRNINAYNDKDQEIEFDEETTIFNEDGTIRELIKTTGKLEYIPAINTFGPDVETPALDILSASTITTSVISPDGSTRTETLITKYDYDKNQKLISASGESVFRGQEASWWQYTDKHGNPLRRSVNAQGQVTYSYLNPGRDKIINIPEEDVISTLKDGNAFEGASKIQFEILSGKPMKSRVDSKILYYCPHSRELLRTDVSTATFTNGLVNNLQRNLKSREHTESTFTQVDEQGNPQTEIKDITTHKVYWENGNLYNAYATGRGFGYELTDVGWWSYESDIDIKYKVFLGVPEQMQYRETKYYKNGAKKEIAE